MTKPPPEAWMVVAKELAERPVPGQRTTEEDCE